LAQVALHEQAFADLERIADFLAHERPSSVAGALRLIREALLILERHPMIGRPAESGVRELVISHGRTGYVALYDFVEPMDLVVVLAIRHQRESGYPEWQ